jgi:4-hydroxy-2-oxoheptanedioate aldolase
MIETDGSALPRVKKKLRDGGTVLVFNPNFPSAALAEYAGGMGFDVIFIDCEHGSTGFEQAEGMARAARAAGITSILRPWSMERGLVTRFLDCGVGGIQFPAIETAEAARQAVDIVRTARGKNFKDTLITIMVESPTAIENLTKIVEVEGIDAVVVGLADLAQSLGHPGDSTHVEVRRAVDRIIDIVGNSDGPVAGFNLHRWEEDRDVTRKGVRWLTIHAKTMLQRGTNDLFGLLEIERG